MSENASAPEQTEYPSPTAELLAEIDHDRAVKICQAFERAALRLGAQVGDVMWAISMLQARVLARAPLGEVQVWTAARFAELTQVALPGALLAQEHAQRKFEGRQAHDA